MQQTMNEKIKALRELFNQMDLSDVKIKYQPDYNGDGVLIGHKLRIKGYVKTKKEK